MSFSDRGDILAPKTNPHEQVRAAIDQGDVALVVKLLTISEVAEDIDYLLLYAARRGAFESVKLLVEHGAKDLKDALLWAPSVEMMEFLIEAGAPINEGEGPLRRCAILGPFHPSFEHVRFLVEHGAIINGRSGSKIGCEALTASAGAGDFEAVKYLLEHGAMVNSIDCGVMYCPALASAVANGQSEIVKFLIDRGAIVNSTDCGVTRCVSLELAAADGHFEIVRFLVEHGAVVNSTSSGVTKSHSAYDALSNNHLEIAKYLLDRGAIVYDDVLRDASEEARAFLEPFSLNSLTSCRNQRFLHRRSSEEIRYLADTANHLLANEKREEYARWLDSMGDTRSQFLRKYSVACRTMNVDDFPSTEGLSDEWLRLIGYPLFLTAAAGGFADELRILLQNARPGLEISLSPSADSDIPIGSTKIGGLPDLPPDVQWPRFKDCTSSYASRPRGHKLCGFVGQFNCEDLARTLCAGRVPDRGLISVFLFSDICNAVDGLRILYHPDLANLQRRDPPGELIKGNQIRQAQSVDLYEAIDISEMALDSFDTDANPAFEEFVDNHCRRTCDMLGYFHALNGGEKFRGTEIEHFLTIQPEDNWNIHIKAPAEDLKNGNFDTAQLVWIDYD